MTIQQELLALRDDEGMIHPADAIEWAAAHPGSELHAAIEWDKEKALREYQLWQVRRLIAIHVVNEDGHRTVISLKADRSHGGGYRAVEDVMQHKQMRAAALEQALADLERLREQYAYLSELAKVFEEADRVRQAATRRRGRKVQPENRAGA